MGIRDFLNPPLPKIEVKPSVTNYWQTAWVDPSTLQILGTTTSDQSALGLPTFFRGVQILTDVAGQLPWRAMRGGVHSDARQLAQPEVVDPQPTLLVKPSPFHTRSDVIRYTIQALILRGNAFFWLSGHDPATGFPTIAVPINPDEVTVQWETDANAFAKKYMWREREMTEGFDLLHIPLLPLLGQPEGLGPLQAAMNMLGYALNAEEFGGEFFKGSATPAGTLRHPGRLDKDEAEALRAQWEAQHQGGRGTAVLSGGLEYSPISITPEQAQFIATRAFNNQQIATLLGIPQHLLNAGQPQGTASSLTYANLGMVMEELYRMTLSPVYLARIEDSFQRLLPRGQSVRFETAELLRTDDASRWASQKIALDAGILTNDEVREIEGRAPLPESELPDPEPVVVEDVEDVEEVRDDERDAPVPGRASE